MACAHPQRHQPRRVCRHLLEAPETEHRIRFRGHDAEPVCAKCFDEVDLPAACDECWYPFVATPAFREFDGFIGTPEPRVDERPNAWVHETIGVDTGPPSRIAPTKDGWVLWSADRRFSLVDLDGRRVRDSVTLQSMGAIAPDTELSLYASPNGRHAALVEERAPHGVVVDLATGAVTMELDRGDDCVEHRRPSIGFVERKGRTILVHATDWNRLDLSDAATGEILSARGPTTYARGEEQPGHYLDYFHSQLAFSPSGTRIADTGWVWHPVGMVRTWSIDAWLTNPWESEDGPSVGSLTQRAYFWDDPLCFLDDERLAIWGIGDDDERMMDALTIWDVVAMKPLAWFPGVWRGRMYADDGYIHIARETGTSTWDTRTGARIACEAGFSPTAWHPTARCFLSVRRDGSLVKSSLRPG